MSFYGPANRLFIENTLRSGHIDDSVIQGCELNDFCARDILWHKTDIEDVHADNSIFAYVRFDESTFTRSGFISSSFNDCSFDTVTLSGLTLIKSIWKNAFFTGGSIRQCTLVRACFTNMQIVNSVLSDFEAAYALIDNCFFLNSTIELNYGNGANGFSLSRLRHCIFYNCRFKGFPFRGSQLDDCLFFYCHGESGEMEGTCMINPKIEQTRKSLINTEREQLIDMLALSLTEAKEPSSVATGAKPEFSNFAQAIQYLKRNFDFTELDLFTTEADLVYVNAADRRILLSDKHDIIRHESRGEPKTADKNGFQTENKDQDQAEPFENGPGRFSHLEF